MWPYRFAILTLVAALQPMIAATTANATPCSSSLVTVVCRRSWNLHWTLAASFAVIQAVFQLVIAVVGSRVEHRRDPIVASDTDFFCGEDVVIAFALRSRESSH